MIMSATVGKSINTTDLQYRNDNIWKTRIQDFSLFMTDSDDQPYVVAVCMIKLDHDLNLCRIHNVAMTQLSPYTSRI